MDLIFSGYKTVLFGDYIKSLRHSRQLPLRKVAAELDLDPSTLGKIERNTRKPPPGVIEGLSRLFEIDRSTLRLIYLSDKINQEILREGMGKEVLDAAIGKFDLIKNLRNKKS